MTRGTLAKEIVDIAALRQRGDSAEKERLARRIFDLWQPIFSHLDGKDFTFHLERHVEEPTSSQIRALFGKDAAGRDRALMIVRVHEHRIAGRTWARLTVNAGFDHAFVQSHFGQEFLAWETWRYRFRHPLRPFFIVDAAVSAASYCVYAKTYSGFAPTRDRPIKEAWWPLAEAGSGALSGEAVVGRPREVRRFPGQVRNPVTRVPTSPRSQEAAAFFEELTRGEDRAGVLVMAPLGFLSMGLTTARYGWTRLRRNRR